MRLIAITQFSYSSALITFTVIHANSIVSMNASGFRGSMPSMRNLGVPTCHTRETAVQKTSVIVTGDTNQYRHGLEIDR